MASYKSEPQIALPRSSKNGSFGNVRRRESGVQRLGFTRAQLLADIVESDRLSERRSAREASIKSNFPRGLSDKSITI